MRLWKVDDNATKDLMIKFIGKYAAGVDKTVALRSAQLELMKEYPLPFYWGAFVLIGR
jgi:CHAT domain-containing protein